MHTDYLHIFTVCPHCSNSRSLCCFRSHQKATADWTELDWSGPHAGRLQFEVRGSWMTSPRQYIPAVRADANSRSCQRRYQGETPDCSASISGNC